MIIKTNFSYSNRPVHHFNILAVIERINGSYSVVALYAADYEDSATETVTERVQASGNFAFVYHTYTKHADELSWLLKNDKELFAKVSENCGG